MCVFSGGGGEEGHQFSLPFVHLSVFQLRKLVGEGDTLWPRAAAPQPGFRDSVN